jgi:Ca-activated chloride channel family protein
VSVELTLDQRLSWLHDGLWEWRFPLALAPRYLGDDGRVADAARVTVDVADAPLAVRASIALVVRDDATPGARVESPSHGIRTEESPGARRVTLASEDGTALDRDLVVRWPCADRRPVPTLDVFRPPAGHASAGSSFGVLTIVPPLPQPAPSRFSRDLVVLLDTSGSMGGAPLDQARRVVSALVSTLDENDQLEIIEFSSAPRRWNRSAVAATEANRRDALAWLSKLRAGGGTEMRSAIVDALAPLRPESQRQVVVVSDGQLGFEHEIVAEILHRLPASSRVHTVGVGSAVNRSLTAPAARAGRGVEVIVGLGEDPERAARRIAAAVADPLVVDLAIEGDAVVEHAPLRLPDLYAGAPALVALKLRPEAGAIVVRGRTRDGTWEARLTASPPGDAADRSAAPMAFFARESVSDLEAAIAAGPEGSDAEDLETRIERIGLDFQVATRLTSWVAVSEEPSVDPSAPTRRVRVPQNLPHGMSFEGLGLRAGAVAAGPAVMGAMAPPAGAPVRAARAVRFGELGARPRSPGKGGIGGAERGGSIEWSRAPAPHQRTGRVTLRKGRLLVIEIDVGTEPLAWAPGNEVSLSWADGSRGTASVAGGTQAGTIAPGHAVRLVLRLSEGAGALPDNPSIVRVLRGGAHPLEILLA